MPSFLDLMKKIDSLAIDNAMLATNNVSLKEKLKSLEAENAELIATNKSLAHKNSNLIELVENLEEQIEELDEECDELYDKCNELDNELENEKCSAISYIAVSLDLSTCIPLVFESPIDAAHELMNKCIAKGIPYGGFKVFEKSELL